MASAQLSGLSPFLQCGPSSKENQLAVLHLKRDLLIPTVLKSEDAENKGYDEGKVTNTRFGSFPHSTLIDIPWGSQVRASIVDTGSRGRRGEGPHASKKRKREGATKEIGGDDSATNDAKIAKEAASGFIHLLPPTPEIWTASLPHRTQVVYTPDYSYILHRIRARPGTRMIEAGAGSGSFTHAAARAVFNGYIQENDSDSKFQERADKTSSFDAPPTERENSVGNAVSFRAPPMQNNNLEGKIRGFGEPSGQDKHPRGRVWSYEFHEQRTQKLKQEITEHGLDGLVQLTHKDVCQEGFIPHLTSPADIKANAIFLDLPAPWLALEHLTRNPFHPLDPQAAVHICTFSPCIEQIQRTVTTLRKLGWLEIEMVEIAAKRIEVRRERVGLREEGLRGVNDSPATVDEALTRLREVEGRTKAFHEESRRAEDASKKTLAPPQQHISKQQRLQDIKDAQEGRKLYKEGRLITKAEPDLKTHTSYLVFAVLPRQWTEEDEKMAQDQSANGLAVDQRLPAGLPSVRQRKKNMKSAVEGNKAVESEREADIMVETT